MRSTRTRASRGAERIGLATLACLCALGPCAVAAAEPHVLGEFTLVERFGVSHPDQIVTFDLPAPIDGSSAMLVDTAGASVPFQVMTNGRLAVRTDLPAGATRRWTLQADKTDPEPGPGVHIFAGDHYYEITNALIGIRIPKPGGDLAAVTPAPIQGLRYQDGTWTARGPNAMSRPARSMHVDIQEAGPLVVRLAVDYTFDRAELRGARMPDVIPAGVGAYRTTIEVQAGQPSILFEEYSEVDVSYAVSVYHGLAPTQGRYRGHHASSLVAGRDANGNQYGVTQTGAGINYVGVRGLEDALVDVSYTDTTKDRWSGTRFPRLSHWDPWAVDTGNYWQLYAPDGLTDNLFGIFGGRPARLLGPGWSGVSIDAGMVDPSEGPNDDRPPRQDAGIRVALQRLTPMQTYARRIRFGWRIFLGTRSADLRPQTETQGIGRQLNLHSGVNLTKLQDVHGDYPDPRAGYGGVYMAPAASRRVMDKLQAEFNAGEHTFFDSLAVDGQLQPLARFWREPTRERALGLYNGIVGFAAAYVETLVNGAGIWDSRTTYFMGSLTFAPHLIVADQLLASGLLTPPERATLKQTLVLYGKQLWDHDQAPTQPEAAVNLGPANMSSMWRGARYSFTAYLSRHPYFRQRLTQVKRQAVELLHAYINDHGACNASAHYTAASMTPILNLYQQLQVSGVANLFAERPEIKRYAEWEMQLLTPPEVRFGGRRKIIAVGDGSTECSTRVGQLGTGVTPGNPELGARLMGAWQEMGSRHSSFLGTSTLKIDETLPATSPDLGDDQFEGWLSVLRHGWGTPRESAVYLINGDSLTDHRHNDMGAVIIYALGAPLSIDWGSIYYPRVAGSMMHSTVTPEFLLTQPWNGDNTALDEPSGGGGLCDWWHTAHTPITSTPVVGSASASWRPRVPGEGHGISWQRTVRSIRSSPAHPVIVIDDHFSGADAARLHMISTLNMMATGPVQTPDGPVTPVARTYNWQDSGNQQLPSVGRIIPLAPGVHRLQFTGQWLIDWDVYLDVDQPAELAIGNWGHTWHPSSEVNEFRQANNRPFEERQHIFRLRGLSRFRTVIIPYSKGQRPENLRVERDAAGLTVRNGPIAVRVTDKSVEEL